MKTICFFGHHYANDFIVKHRLLETVKSYLEKEEINFLIGTHGNFDNIAYEVCKNLKQNYKCKITVVYTSFSFLKHKPTYPNFVNTLIYEIENVYYKDRINFSNKKMIDESDIVITYVNTKNDTSGAYKAFKYALKNNKILINLYRRDDEIFSNLSLEEIKQRFSNYWYRKVFFYWH